MGRWRGGEQWGIEMISAREKTREEQVIELDSKETGHVMKRRR